MKKFFEHLRYEYHLNPHSLCVDCGAYHGEWARQIAYRYGCRVIAFEPVLEYFREAVMNCMVHNNVVLINSAVATSGASDTIGVSNDSSGKFSLGPPQDVSVVKLVPLMTFLGEVDVLKLNCEGSEYDLLDTLLNTGLVKKIKNVQVQFHKCAPDWENKYTKIVERLNATHEQEWDYGIVWQNWRLR